MQRKRHRWTEGRLWFYVFPVLLAALLYRLMIVWMRLETDLTRAEILTVAPGELFGIGKIVGIFIGYSVSWEDIVEMLSGFA